MNKLLILIFLILTSTLSAEEGLLSKLLSPGPLIEGHKDLEHTECLECHTAAEGIDNNKCLDCHKEIKKSVQNKKSFHGRQSKPCYECHIDHKGRAYNSTKVNLKTFDHNKTDYKLVGAHKKIKCKECHTTKRTKKPIRKSGTRWFGQQKNCNSCHKSDDIHKFQGDFAKKECSSCHGELSWKKDITFDHKKDTGYALLGSHNKLKCDKCHTPINKTTNKYKWPKLKTDKCLSCHKDVHKNNLSPKFRGGNCAKCHNNNSWKIKSFDHRVTNFPLKGKHSRIDCVKCHKGQKTSERKNFKWTGLKQQCSYCHNDYHSYAGQSSQRFGKLSDCMQCHKDGGWKQNINFNHNYDTRFDITGKHKKNKCFDCHVAAKGQNKNKPKKRIYHWAQLDKKTCETCHKSPHKKEFSKKLLQKKCTACHTTEGWDRTVGKAGKNGAIDHNTTRFPLTGKHKKVKCNDCHIVNGKRKFKFPLAEKKFCNNCHKNVHKKQFSSKFSQKSCAECHTTNNFKKFKVFNHNKTKFKLTGKHKDFKNKCGSCHIKTNKMMPTTPPKPARKFIFASKSKGYCQDCHKNVHTKQFHKKFSKKSCADCHTTKTFKKRPTFDHDMTRFPLKGKHKDNKCTECHKKTKRTIPTKPPKPMRKYIFPKLESKNCNNCHKDPHRGAFGSKCYQCHNENSWKSSKNFHRNFDMSGVHYTLTCEECHTKDRKLEGLSSQCILCHQKDDIHARTLPECSDCHRQSFWEINAFQHSTSLFPLLGAHRTLECSACHQQGTYAGLTNDCQGCHAARATTVTSPDHSSDAFTECKSCHNQFSFSGTTSVK